MANHILENIQILSFVDMSTENKNASLNSLLTIKGLRKLDQTKSIITPFCSRMEAPMLHLL
jgi:hypothetical protein